MARPLAVSTTRSAERDLLEIGDYIAAHDSPRRAAAVMARLSASVAKLGLFPQRGSYPKELLALGLTEYRQVFVKPYRIIYYTAATTVTVVVVIDGRRDLEALLARRLLRP